MEKASSTETRAQEVTLSRRNFLKFAGKAALGTGGALLLGQADLQSIFAQGPEGTPQPTPIGSEPAPWEKAGVSKDIYLSYYNYAHQQLPPGLAERTVPSYDNPITFDFQKDGFVDARGRIYRPNLTEDTQDMEAGWVTEFDSYYSQKNNTTIVMEGNPDRLGKRKVGDKFTDIKFTSEFKGVIDDWIEKYGTKLKGQMVHLTFTDSYSDNNDTKVATPTLGSAPKFTEALQGFHFGYHKFIHIYSSGEAKWQTGKNSTKTIFSMAVCDALILANSGYEGISPASVIFTDTNLNGSIKFLLPGIEGKPPYKLKYFLVTFPKP